MLATYSTDANFDNVLADTTLQYVFGHSDALSARLGYWVIVHTIVCTGYAKSQIAIGSSGHAASRFYTDSKWSNWIVFETS